MKRNLLFLFVTMGWIMKGYATDGFYMEYKISTGKGGAAGGMKTYYQDGNTRSEVSFSMGGGSSSPGLSQNIVMLALKDKPDMAYMLDVDKKTYNEMDASKTDASQNYTADDYEVSVLGKEKVNGYNTTHVKIKNKKTASFEEEMWVTTEIDGYADLEKIKTKYTGTESLNAALKAKGANGFPARIVIKKQNTNAQLDLVKIEKKNNPDSLFSLKGYTKSTDAPGSASMQQLMQQMQNMTPEQKKQFLQQMQQQMGGSH